MANVSGHSNNTDLIDSEPHPALLGVLYLLASTIVLLNVPSVCIVLYSIFKKSKVKNVHILSLSITDGVLGLLWFLIIDTHKTVDGSISYSECVIRFYFISTTYLASCSHILAICVERVCVICFKVTAFTENRKTVAVGSIIVSWMFALVSMALEYGLQADDSGEVTCSLVRIFPSSYPTAGIILTGIQTGSFISTVILIGYLIKHMREMKALNIRKISKDDVRSSLTTVIIVAIGIVFNTPWSIVTIYGPTAGRQPRRVKSILFGMSACNSALNPVIYVFRIKEYRTLLKQALCCFKTRISPE